jgi:hypothetical protein
MKSNIIAVSVTFNLPKGSYCQPRPEYTDEIKICVYNDNSFCKLFCEELPTRYGKCLQCLGACRAAGDTLD